MASANKDAPQAVAFMTLFSRVKDWCDDRPEELSRMADGDEVLSELCEKLWEKANHMKRAERRRRELFASPVDTKFIEAWREFEQRYDRAVWEVVWWPIISADLNSLGEPDEKSPEIVLWEIADDAAGETARGLQEAVDLGRQEAEMAADNGREFPEGFVEAVVDGADAWDRLKKEAGFDLRGVFRRRELVPFVLIPRHVAAGHGGTDPAMLRNLLEAHEAFVYGTPRACVGMLRSIMEVVLREHYGATGKDLYERIESVRRLPAKANHAALHTLRKRANSLLHLSDGPAEKPLDSEPAVLERQIVAFLFVLRVLIENTPQRKR